MTLYYANSSRPQSPKGGLAGSYPFA